MRISLIFLFLAITVSACKTTKPQPESENTGPRKTMLQYDEPVPLNELWNTWTPVPKTGIPELLSTAAVFDYWQVKDENEIEEVWTVLATLLSGLRSQSTDEEAKLSFRSTLSLLEPSPSDRLISTLDFTFLTSPFSEKPIHRWEGVVIRWSKKTYKGSPTITLFLSRLSTSKTAVFDKVHLWIEPGFSEIPAQSFTMRRGETWQYQVSRDLIFEATSGEIKDAKIYTDVLGATLWKKVTNGSYVKYDKMEKGVEGVFGERKLRDIEMVFERTQFPPRFDF